jgi:hypothetical protein
MLATVFFKFPLEEILYRALSPNIWIRANVGYETREKAKSRQFMYDGNTKKWYKNLKEVDLALESKEYDFTYEIMPADFKGL